MEVGRSKMWLERKIEDRRLKMGAPISYLQTSISWQSPPHLPSPIFYLAALAPHDEETNMKFEDLEAWQSARRLTKQVYALTRTPELVRDFGVTGQIQRASVSIMSNVAEGFERSHIQEKLQFYNVARSSTAEVRSLLYVVEDNYPGSAATAVQIREETGRTGRLVTGLIQSTERRRPSKIAHLLSSIFHLLTW